MSNKNIINEQNKRTNKVIKKTIRNAIEADELIDKKLQHDAKASPSEMTKKAAEESLEILGVKNGDEDTETPLETLAQENSLEDMSKQNGGAMLAPKNEALEIIDEIKTAAQETPGERVLSVEQFEALKNEITRAVLGDLIPLMEALEKTAKAQQEATVLTPKQQQQQELNIQKDRVKNRAAKIKMQMSKYGRAFYKV